MTDLLEPAPGSYRLSRHVLTRIEQALRASANQRLACHHARISAPTYRRWRDQGYRDLQAWTEQQNIDPADLDLNQFLTDIPFQDQPFIHFVLTVEKAISDFELENLAAISVEAVGHPVTETTTVEKVLYERVDEQNVRETLVERTTTTRTKQSKSWLAAMTLLDRCLPNQYARTIRQEISGGSGQPVQLDVNTSASARLQAQLAQMKANDEQAQSLLIDADSRELDEG